jgi:TetR/AcrR family transcriptional repressor of nem operon
MRRTHEQKRQTHDEILRAAAHAFRERGFDGAGVAELMRDAGLTHGGFYAHFPSKAALLGEAAAYGLEESGEAFFDDAARAAPDDPLREILRRYLSRGHRDAPATGCMLPALAGEIARETAEVRRRFTDALETYLARLAEHIPAADDAARRDNALALLSGMVGALVLSRAVDDPALSDGALLATRRFLTAAFADSASTNTADPGTGPDVT